MRAALFVLFASLCLDVAQGQSAPVTVRGRFVLLARNSMPLEGASVEVGGKTALTDAEGYYRVQGVPAGQQTLKVVLAGFASWKIELDLMPGEDRALPDLASPIGMCGYEQDGPFWMRMLAPGTPSGGLRGDVHELKKDGYSRGNVVKNAKVTLECGSRVCGTTLTDSQGRYRFESLEAGVYMVLVERETFYPEREGLFKVVAGFESVFDGRVGMLACIEGDCLKYPRPELYRVCE